MHETFQKTASQTGTGKKRTKIALTFFSENKLEAKLLPACKHLTLGHYISILVSVNTFSAF